ncbi:hypothetical protein Bca4012_020798 [Brassica carinata]
MTKVKILKPEPASKPLRSIKKRNRRTVRGTADHPEGDFNRRIGEAGTANPGPAIASSEVHSRHCYLKKLPNHALRVLAGEKKPVDEKKSSTMSLEIVFSTWNKRGKFLPKRPQEETGEDGGGSKQTRTAKAATQSHSGEPS